MLIIYNSWNTVKLITRYHERIKISVLLNIVSRNFSSSKINVSNFSQTLMYIFKTKNIMINIYPLVFLENVFCVFTISFC